MRIQEAEWIHRNIRQIVAGTGAARSGNRGTVLNLGSGNFEAQRRGKPYIYDLTIKRFIDAGYRIVNSDLFPGEGVELVGDLLDPAFVGRLRDMKPDLVYLCNVLEHIPASARDLLAGNIVEVIPPGGHLLVTVPQSYPYHADPIDTMFRPTPDEIARLFPGLEVESAETVRCGSYGDEFVAGGVFRMIRKVLRLLAPFVRFKRWLSHAHRFLWLGRPYLQACVLLRASDKAKGGAASCARGSASLAGIS